MSPSPRIEYISRKVMDRYQDRMAVRLERMYDRIRVIEAMCATFETEFIKLKENVELLSAAAEYHNA